MIALLFHKDTELYLLKQQKMMIQTFNNAFSKKNISVVIPHFPLLCVLENPFFENKTENDLKQTIKSFTISGISYFQEDNTFFFNAKITILEKDKEIYINEKILFASIEDAFSKTENIQDTLKDLEKNLNSNFLPLNCRVFKVCSYKKEGIFTHTKNPVWIKCQVQKN